MWYALLIYIVSFQYRGVRSGVTSYVCAFLSCTTLHMVRIVGGWFCLELIASCHEAYLHRNCSLQQTILSSPTRIHIS
ncbi:hypothetical protein F5B20DRAFT_522999 [Whalleya microplaca]|nr:hypothetical protein F5B20DRAFT_522999 [Whalleya microplaca]